MKVSCWICCEAHRVHRDHYKKSLQPP